MMIDEQLDAGEPSATTLTAASELAGPLTEHESARWLKALNLAAGERYSDCRLANFRAITDEQIAVRERCQTYVGELPERIAAGAGLILTGRTGTGKDHLAFAIARAAIIKGYTAKFCNGLAWHGRIRDTITAGGPAADQIEPLILPSLLVLSDPVPPDGLTEFQRENVLRVVDGRYRERRPTILTINLASDEAGRKYIGAQAWSRLKQDTEIIWCPWADYRTARPPPRV